MGRRRKLASEEIPFAVVYHSLADKLTRSLPENECAAGVDWNMKRASATTDEKDRRQGMIERKQEHCQSQVLTRRPGSAARAVVPGAVGPLSPAAAAWLHARREACILSVSIPDEAMKGDISFSASDLLIMMSNPRDGEL